MTLSNATATTQATTRVRCIRVLPLLCAAASPTARRHHTASESGAGPQHLGTIESEAAPGPKPRRRLRGTMHACATINTEVLGSALSFSRYAVLVLALF